MNSIAASLLYHSDEVIAFDLLVRLLNDYHLKEVHKTGLSGFFEHSNNIELLVNAHLPPISAHLKQHQVKMI